MSHQLKIIAQLENTETGEIIEEKVVQQKILVTPKSYNDFGFRHGKQVDLIKNSQDLLIKYECKLLCEHTKCPECGSKLRKQGTIESDFHDVYTDHRVSIQRVTCLCGWRNKFTLNSIYGSATHPELAQLQTKHGANHSFEKTTKLLNY